MTVRIICVGNRFVPQDAAGPAVYSLLRAGELPAGVELIDGGIAGLDLLRWVEGARRVVFVDALCEPPGREVGAGVVLLTCEEVAARAGMEPGGAYGHAAGLSALLRLIPAVCSPPPEVLVVGVRAKYGEAAPPAALDLAAARALAACGPACEVAP